LDAVIRGVLSTLLAWVIGFISVVALVRAEGKFALPLGLLYV
jgi:hypothetical protein